MRRLFTFAILMSGLLPLSHAGAATQPEAQSKSGNSAYVVSPGRSYLGVDIRDITQAVGPLNAPDGQGGGAMGFKSLP